MNLNNVLFLNLPPMIDEEGHMIYLVPIKMPSFARINGYSFTLTPTDSKRDVGIHDITFALTDNILSLNWRKTYTFRVKVVNSRPYFAKKLENIKLPINKNQTKI